MANLFGVFAKYRDIIYLANVYCKDVHPDYMKLLTGDQI